MRNGVDLRKYTLEIAKIIKSYRKNVSMAFEAGLVAQVKSDSEQISTLKKQVDTLALENLMYFKK